MAGKGDMPRPYDRRRYEEGFARIDWSHCKGDEKRELSLDEGLVSSVGGETKIYSFDLLKEEQQKMEASLGVPAHLLTGNGKGEVGHG